MTLDVIIRYALIPALGLWAAQQLIRELIGLFNERKQGLWN